MIRGRLGCSHFIQRCFEWRRRGERHESIAELQGRYQVPQDVLSLVIYSCLHVKTGQRAGPQYNASAKTSLHSRALHVRTDRFYLWLLSQHNLYMLVDVLYAGHPSQIRSTNLPSTSLSITYVSNDATLCVYRTRRSIWGLSLCVSSYHAHRPYGSALHTELGVVMGYVASSCRVL